jgi:feruloyl-CoA synthase
MAARLAPLVGTDLEVVLTAGAVPGPRQHELCRSAGHGATPAVDAAMQATGPDTIAKFLFTSGSTKLPKAVINTQGMWCANQQQMLPSRMPLLAEEPPVLVDWLPWNHTFGGNHNFGMVALQRRHAVHRRRQAHAGADRRDPAQPARDRAHGVLQRAHRLRGHRHGHEDRRRAAPQPASRACKMFFYVRRRRAGPAGVGQPVRIEEREIGERIVMSTGLGMTESGPFGLFVTNPNVKAGDLGVPAPGLEIKLVDLQRQVRGALPRAPTSRPATGARPPRRPRRSTRRASSAPATRSSGSTRTTCIWA